MFDVVLWEPEIPQNTGNLMRLTVNTGCALHLIEPLGFALDEARLRRAGLDYREFATVATYPDWATYVATARSAHVYAFSQHADVVYTDIAYHSGDTLLFGKESTGLDAAILESEAVDEQVRIPIAPNGRSLNLANAAAIAVYEAWRQQGFAM